MANPHEEEYRSKVESYVNDMFTETLNEALAKEVAERQEDHCGRAEADSRRGVAIEGV